MPKSKVPIIGVTAFSGTGKTTLLKQLIPLLRARGLRVGVIKHTHHDFDVDRPGKDSYELRHAGAAETLLASGRRWALMVETDGEGDPELARLLERMDQRNLDLVLVEGFKHERFPKIELHRPSLGKPLLFPDDPDVIAVAADAPIGRETQLPLLDLNDPEVIVAFILTRVPSR